jgi:fructoselysine-6-P-deglycase FrlB-like protein
MNELMRQEILDQPAAIRRALEQPAREQVLRALAPDSLQRLIFTGSGDSYFAPLALRFAAQRLLGASVAVLPAQEAAAYQSFQRGDVVVGISISGNTPRTAEAVGNSSRAGAHTLAITGNPASALARNSDALWELPFRSRSRATPHTTDYMSTLVAVASLIGEISGTPVSVFAGLADSVQRALETLYEPCMAAGRALAKQERFFFLGAGSSFATAQYGAAKLWEAGGLMALPFELEEFAHGPHLILRPGDAVLIIAPEGKSLERAVDILAGIKKLGGAPVVVTNRPDKFPKATTLVIPLVDEEWSPFFTALPLQWFCWALAGSRGYDVVSKEGTDLQIETYDQVQKEWLKARR